MGLLLLGLLIRLPGLTTPSVEQRESQSALISRGWYLGAAPTELSAEKRAAAAEIDRVVKPIEPPILELAAAGFYRVTNREAIWFPRLLSALAWIGGGAFLALIARRVTNTAGSLATVVLFVFWPYAAWHSRKFMPDALLVASLLAAVLVIARYWERPSRSRFLVAASTSAVATVIKPGVGFSFVLAVYLAFALEGKRPRREIVSGRTLLFAATASSLALAYFLVGRYATHFVNPHASAGRITPDELIRKDFWVGWWEMASHLLRFPQPQGWLAIVPLALGALGLALAPRGEPRTILWGLTVGYLTFGLAFANYTATHPYYALPLVPILALAIGLVVGRLYGRLSARGMTYAAALAGLVMLVALGGAQRTYATLTTPAPAQIIEDYRRIGEITHHTTRAIVVDDRLAHPIMYWGWIVAQAWELDYNSDLPDWIDPRSRDFLIVVGSHQFKHPGLRAFASDLPVLARSERYTVFDLRQRPA